MYAKFNDRHLRKKIYCFFKNEFIMISKTIIIYSESEPREWQNIPRNIQTFENQTILNFVFTLRLNFARVTMRFDIFANILFSQ